MFTLAFFAFSVFGAPTSTADTVVPETTFAETTAPAAPAQELDEDNLRCESCDAVPCGYCQEGCPETDCFPDADSKKTKPDARTRNACATAHGTTNWNQTAPKCNEDTAPPDWFAVEVASIRGEDSADVYETQALWEAIKKWDDKNANKFFVVGEDKANKEMLAAFLGNVAQETGQLKFPQELGPPNYTSDSPCTVASGNCAENYGKYFGRGSLQVTCWGGDYCSAYSEVAKAYDINDMENNPDQIATNPQLAWGSGIVYWMSNKGVSGYEAYTWLSKNSFGGTYETINGALECPPGNTATPPTSDKRVANRINNFEKACVAAGLECSQFVMNCPTSPILTQTD